MRGDISRPVCDCGVSTAATFDLLVIFSTLPFPSSVHKAISVLPLVCVPETQLPHQLHHPGPRV